MRRSNQSTSELERIRREWRLQQQRMESHQRRKEIFIKQYEIQRAHRLKQLTGGTRLFKGPEGTQISPTELRKIKVDIYRNIPGESAANELQRDIVNPEDVVVKRKAGEGSKPIFEREELTKAIINTEDVEEHRTVATVKDENLEKESQKRRSTSLSLTRNRSQSHRRTSFRYSRYEDYKQSGRENCGNNSNRGRSRDRSKEDRRRTQSCHIGDGEKRLKEKRNGRGRSRSRERDFYHCESIRGKSRERKMPSQQIPIPTYFGNFSPRPGMIGPLVPIGGHVAFGRSRYSVWPMRPFEPRFPPGIDIYRLRPPGNPRGFGPQY